ncbi:MAG TPA: CHASE3 domain-containing protein [Rhizomicrobium sp.]|nr:CHASE3 domain-containing protein [Rhizomicrobium sp.]
MAENEDFFDNSTLFLAGRPAARVLGQARVFSARVFALMAVPALVLLLGIAALGVRLSQEETTSRNFVVHTNKTIGAADKILSDMDTTTRLERGYQLQQGQASPLAIYADLKAMPDDVKRFEALTAGNPAQQARALKLEALLNGWKKDIAEETEITRASHTEDVPQTPSEARLRWLMSDALAKVDEIHAILQEVKAEENRLLAQGMTKTRGFERSTLMTALLGVLFVLVTLGTATALLLRSNTRLMRAEAARAREAALLRSALESVRDGVAAFNADMTLSAFNQAFFTLSDLPLSLAEIGTPLQRLRLAEAGRREKVLPEKLLGREVHQVVVSDRRLEIHATAMPNEGAFVVVADLSGREQGAKEDGNDRKQTG